MDVKQKVNAASIEFWRTYKYEKRAKAVQKDVAAIFNVREDSITYWDNHRSEPKIKFYPCIFGFLCYCPFKPDAYTFSGRTKAYRYLNGLNQKRFTKLLNLEHATVCVWGNGKGQGGKKRASLSFFT